MTKVARMRRLKDDGDDGGAPAASENESVRKIALPSISTSALPSPPATGATSIAPATMPPPAISTSAMPLRNPEAASLRAARARGNQRDWYTQSGARTLKEKSLVGYREWLERAAHPQQQPLEEDHQQIELDLSRIADSVREFLIAPSMKNEAKRAHVDKGNQGDEEDVGDGSREDEALAPYVTSVRNVLLAYSMTTTWCDEEEAFWIYTNVMERIFPDDFFARTPKLHGFQIDAKLLGDLVATRLVPHMPRLAQVDLTLVTSLLACKWFVCLWVGALPRTMLIAVWDCMLCERNGTFLHLLLSLYLIRCTCANSSALADRPASPTSASFANATPWEASFLYQEILSTCRTLPESTSLDEIVESAHALYQLSDEGVEDMRAAIRGESMFQTKETRALIQSVHFQPFELRDLHDEFLFARNETKKCTRQQLRGVRQEFVDGLLSRDFPMLSPDFRSRVCDYGLQTDANGNVSFFSLIQLLSVLHRGTIEERALLLFSISDRRQQLVLKQDGMEDLADTMCSLAVGQAITSHETMDVGYDMNYRPEDSPLLRKYFRDLVLEMRDRESGELRQDEWLRQIIATAESRWVVREWGGFPEEGDIEKDAEDTAGESSYGNVRGTHPAIPVLLEDCRGSVFDNQLRHDKADTNERRKQGRTSTGKPFGVASRREHISRGRTTKQFHDSTISLLSDRMKHSYASTLGADRHERNSGAVRRHHRSGDGSEFGSQVFWCECTIC